METTITTTLTPDELAAVDWLRLGEGASRAEVIREAVRWYARWAEQLPVEDPVEDDIDL